MKENCDWKKCLDRIEDKGFDDDDAVQRFSNISERWLLLMSNVRCYKMWSNV